MEKNEKIFEAAVKIAKGICANPVTSPVTTDNLVARSAINIAKKIYEECFKKPVKGE